MRRRNRRQTEETAARPFVEAWLLSIRLRGFDPADPRDGLRQLGTYLAVRSL